MRYERESKMHIYLILIDDIQTILSKLIITVFNESSWIAWRKEDLQAINRWSHTL